MDALALSDRGRFQNGASEDYRTFASASQLCTELMKVTGQELGPSLLSFVTGVAVPELKNAVIPLPKRSLAFDLYEAYLEASKKPMCKNNMKMLTERARHAKQCRQSAAGLLRQAAKNAQYASDARIRNLGNSFVEMLNSYEEEMARMSQVRTIGQTFQGTNVCNYDDENDSLIEALDVHCERIRQGLAPRCNSDPGNRPRNSYTVSESRSGAPSSSPIYSTDTYGAISVPSRPKTLFDDAQYYLDPRQPSIFPLPLQQQMIQERSTAPPKRSLNTELWAPPSEPDGFQVKPIGALYNLPEPKDEHDVCRNILYTLESEPLSPYQLSRAFIKQQPRPTPEADNPPAMLLASNQPFGETAYRRNYNIYGKREILS